MRILTGFMSSWGNTGRQNDSRPAGRARTPFPEAMTHAEGPWSRLTFRGKEEAPLAPIRAVWAHFYGGSVDGSDRSRAGCSGRQAAGIEEGLKQITPESSG